MQRTNAAQRLCLAMVLLWLLSLNVRGAVLLTNLFSFGPLYDTNGVNPRAGLVEGPDGNFYGTTSGGPGRGGPGRPSIRGTVFRITSEGVLTTIARFYRTNGDSPRGGLVLDTDGNIFGTTGSGGKMGYGTIFKVNRAGVLKILISFEGLTATNGWAPQAGLTPSKDGNYYGTTSMGGTKNLGTVFRLSSDGKLVSLVSFVGTNGAYPSAELIQDEKGNLYGTTSYGGAFKGQLPPEDSGFGTVFRLAPDGTYTTLFSFSGVNGREPRGRLVEDRAGNFYGTTRWGGNYGEGTVFRLTPAGILTNLFSFNGTNGAWPCATLVSDNNGNLIGATETGGIGYNGTPAYGNGTVFRITTNGVLATLIYFNGTNGVNPQAGLVRARDGSFYGTATYGGAYNLGLVFRFRVADTP